MLLLSLDFEDGEQIPDRFSCDGLNVNPSLRIEDAPDDAESLAIMMEDPDAPAGVWTHWLVWNIPPKTKEIGQSSLSDGAVEGINSAGSQEYQGPCPPSGVHHYIFHLYALDVELDIDSQAERDDFLLAIDGHVVAETTLTGLYGRQ